MDQLQITPEYIRNEQDFLTPLSPVERFRRILSPQAALAPQVYPTNWIPGIDISGIGQTKAIAAAFPQLFAAGWKLVIMRASIGLTVDALFDYFWQAAYDAGMYLMAYHFAYPTYTAASQASIFLKTIDPMLTKLDGHSAAILDVEAPGDITAWRNTVTGFHSIVKTKLVPGDYSSVAKWKSCTNNMPVSGFAWNASWSNIVNVPSFAPIEQTILRQVGVYLKHAFVPKPPGVNEDVDVNYFMGSETDLRKFLGYGETPPPPPPPSDLEKKVTDVAAKVDALVIENSAQHTKMQNDISNNTVSIVNLQSDVEALKRGDVPSTKPRFQIGASQANCRVIVGYNDPDPPATPKPIMDIPPVGPHRIHFDAGAIVLLESKTKVDADSSIDFYKVDPSQYLPGEPAQYLRTIDGVLL